MIKKFTLNTLKPGERARIGEVTGEPLMKRRLEELGLIPGTVVRGLMKSMLGDPVAYEIRGAVIALRARDTAGVLVERLADDGKDRLPGGVCGAPEGALWD